MDNQSAAPDDCPMDNQLCSQDRCGIKVLLLTIMADLSRSARTVATTYRVDGGAGGTAYEAFKTKKTDLGRHIYLRQLQDSNETLFYRLMLEHIEEMMPIVYTPTVGLACQQFSHIYRRPRGLIVSYPLRDSINEILRNRPNPEVKR